MGDPLDHIRIVLVRPKFAANIGATARAMANTGLHRLVLVAPSADRLSIEARKRGARAGHILQHARTTADLDAALDGVIYAVGLTCRGGLYRDQIEVSPEVMAATAVTRARQGAVAILFGPEDNGLTNAELLSCDTVVRIPSCDAYPSLNLAHAVMVIAYELFRAAVQPRTQTGPAADHADDLADGAMIDRLMKKYREALLKIGYLHTQNPQHLLFPLRGILARARITHKEAQILMGMAQQIDEYASRTDHE